MDDTGIFGNAYDNEDVSAEADLNNLETTMNDRSNQVIFAYASFMGFIMYQMDVKSAFLYDTIDEEVYVDDIIFGSTKKSLCDEFEDETVYKEWEDRMERATTAASSLDAEARTDEIEVNAGNSNFMLLVLVTAIGLLTTVRHNLVLPVQVNTAEEKLAESDGFHEIIDFRMLIHYYALPVNPTIYNNLHEYVLGQQKREDSHLHYNMTHGSKLPLRASYTSDRTYRSGTADQYLETKYIWRLAYEMSRSQGCGKLQLCESLVECAHATLTGMERDRRTCIDACGGSELSISSSDIVS
ncbi:hypothetical protein Tco_1525116 [Tanacetum coccineum]